MGGCPVHHSRAPAEHLGQPVSRRPVEHRRVLRGHCTVLGLDSACGESPADDRELGGYNHLRSRVIPGPDLTNGRFGATITH